jgi:nucleoside-diphosphate-sugar epimerase
VIETVSPTQTVVVTGANGLIGYAVAEHLHKQGWNVIGVVRKKVEEYPFPIVECDLLNLSLLHLVEKYEQVAEIIHCAAIIPSVRNSGGDYFTANQRLDDNILHACKYLNCRTIFSSGTTISEHQGYLEQALEDKDCNKYDSPYLKSKIITENKIIQSGLQYAIMRIPSPFGIRQKHTNVLTTFIDRALRGDDLHYHGTGQREQNFLYADDIAKACGQILRKPIPEIIVNIAYQKSLSMKDLAMLIVDIAQPTTSKVLPSGKDDVQEFQRVKIPTQKALSVLNWQPSTTIKHALAEIIFHRRRRQSISV